MNKIQKLALDDYLIDPSEMNLKLLTLSVNPLFNLKGSAKSDVIALINKYKSDPSKLRLASLETYLGSTKTQKTKIAKATKIPVITAATSPEHPELKALRQALANLYARGSTSEPGIKEQIDLSDKIRRLETQLGLQYDMSDGDLYRMGTSKALESKQAMFRGIFGDWEQEGTPGWSLTHPDGLNSFSITDTAFAGLWFNPDNKNIFDQQVYERNQLQRAE